MQELINHLRTHPPTPQTDPNIGYAILALFISTLLAIFVTLASFLATAMFYAIYAKSMSLVCDNRRAVDRHLLPVRLLALALFFVAFVPLFVPLGLLFVFCESLKNIRRCYDLGCRSLSKDLDSQDSVIILEIERLGLTHRANDLRLPAEYYDPITYELLTRPVISAAGITYQLDNARRWYIKKNSEPASGVELTVDQKKLFPNHTMEGQIMDHLKEIAANQATTDTIWPVTQETLTDRAYSYLRLP